MTSPKSRASRGFRRSSTSGRLSCTLTSGFRHPGPSTPRPSATRSTRRCRPTARRLAAWTSCTYSTGVSIRNGGGRGITTPGNFWAAPTAFASRSPGSRRRASTWGYTSRGISWTTGPMSSRPTAMPGNCWTPRDCPTLNWPGVSLRLPERRGVASAPQACLRRSRPEERRRWGLY